MFESDGVGGQGVRGSTAGVFKGLRLTIRQLVYVVSSITWLVLGKKSMPVFAFNMIGASCATLHSKPGDSVAF